MVGLSIVTRFIKPFICAEIAMKDKLGMMHLQLKVGIVGTRNAD